MYIISTVFTKLNLMLLTSVNIKKRVNIFHLSPKTSVEYLRCKIKFTSTSSYTQLLCFQLWKQYHVFFYHFDWTGEFYELFPEFQWTSFIETATQITGTYNFLHRWTRNYWNNRYIWMSYFDSWCIWNKIFTSKVFTTQKMVIHQLTNQVFSRIIS